MTKGGLVAYYTRTSPANYLSSINQKTIMPLRHIITEKSRQASATSTLYLPEVFFLIIS
jgi:hypothetical protein